MVRLLSRAAMTMSMIFRRIAIIYHIPKHHCNRTAYQGRVITSIIFQSNLPRPLHASELDLDHGVQRDQRWILSLLGPRYHIYSYSMTYQMNIRPLCKAPATSLNYATWYRERKWNHILLKTLNPKPLSPKHRGPYVNFLSGSLGARAHSIATFCSPVAEERLGPFRV